MKDILSPNGGFLAWANWQPDGGDWLGEQAYSALLTNLYVIPTIEATVGPPQIFFEAEDGEQMLCIWQFEAPPVKFSSSWI